MRMGPCGVSTLSGGGGGGGGVKLHALDGQALMAQAHDLAFGRAGAHLERIREALGLGDQGMISTRRKILRQAREQAPAVVLHRRDFAMHQSTRTHDFAAECFDQGLMPETNAEDRHAPRKGLDHLQ
jgi:hypothetical protein